MSDVNRVDYLYLNEIFQHPEYRKLHPIFEHIFEIIRQNRDRTGGDQDLVADTEVAVVSHSRRADSNRQIKDQIDELMGLITQNKRHMRRIEQDISELKDSVSQTKGRSKLSGQRLDALQDSIDAQKKISRFNEQKINELTERYDSGT